MQKRKLGNLRPLQNLVSIVAAVCGRRGFPANSHFLGAHRAPLQVFCRGSRVFKIVGGVLFSLAPGFSPVIGGGLRVSAPSAALGVQESR